MAGVVKSMDSALKSMNLEKVLGYIDLKMGGGGTLVDWHHADPSPPCHCFMLKGWGNGSSVSMAEHDDWELSLPFLFLLSSLSLSFSLSLSLSLSLPLPPPLMCRLLV